MAHRGASRAQRENTLAAFAHARELGAHAVELDARRTADGVLVVHHDARLADGRALVALAAADLPDHVPTLEAALDECTPMWVNVEIKNAPTEPDFDVRDTIADDVIALLLARPEPADRWLISSFRRETIDRCRRLAPQVATAWLTVAASPDMADDLRAAGHCALHPWYGSVTPELVRGCHDAGIEVNVWTCDEPDDMERLLEMGVDGICTNVPDVALAVLGRAGGAAR